MMQTPARQSETATTVIEQRRSHRVQIFGRLHGHLVALDVAVTVTDLSTGGLSLETPIDFPIGAVHEFRLALNDVATVRIKGRIVHCRLVSGTDDNPRYAAGAEFMYDDQDDAARTIRDLIDQFK